MSAVTVGFAVMEQIVMKNSKTTSKEVSRAYHVRTAAEQLCEMLRKEAERAGTNRRFHVSEVRRPDWL